MRILIVLTSNGEMGEDGTPTGFWLDELAAPYLRFKDAGAEVTLASPAGGRPPVDPMSTAGEARTAATRRFEADVEAQEALSDTTPLAEIDPDAYDAVFFPGGHGPLWDLAENPDSIRIVEKLVQSGRPVAAVCHGPAALCRALLEDGTPIVTARPVTGFSDSEEAAVGLENVVPFSIEGAMRRLGAAYDKAPDFQPYVTGDRLVITGQNPASSEPTADRLVERLAETHPAA